MKTAALLLAVLALSATPAHAAVPYPRDAQVFYEPCPGYPNEAGCVFPDGRIYVPRQLDDEDGRATRSIVLHELGHLFLGQMADWRKERFRRIYRTRLRWGGVLDERFADAYSNCAVEAMPSSWRWMDGYGYQPSRRVHRKVCALIAR